MAAAAGLTAMVWLSMAGAGDQPTGYLRAATAGMTRVTLPRVEVVASRRAHATLVAACPVDRSSPKRG